MNRYKFLPTYRYYEVEGNPVTINKSSGKPLRDYRIYGNSIQNGTPLIENPVEVQSLGDKTLNLFDITQINASQIEVNEKENYFVVSGYSVATGITPSTFLEMTGLKIGDTFTISAKREALKGSGTAVNPVTFLSRNSNVSSIPLLTRNKTINTITIPEEFTDDNYHGLYTYGCSSSDENGERLMRYSNFMILKGEYTEETLPEYEPYNEYKIPVKVSNDEKQEITNIYLNEPLRKIGDYVDYIDFQNQKVVRNIYAVLMDSNRTIVKYTSDSTELGYYYALNISKKAKYDVNTINIMVCNRFYPVRNSVEQFKKGTMACSTTGMRVVFNIEADTVDDVKQFLDNNPTRLYYVLATPIEEDIELPEILTNKGINIIEIETTIQPSNIAVTYLGKKIEVTTSLTEEQINAINNMNITTDNGEIIINYDDETLDFDFNIENENLIVENNVNELDFNINENGEMEVSY